jgi:succinoglycan biosynthesis transport protein ExoP
MNQQALQDVRQYLAMIHKRRGIVATCLGVSMLVATLYNYTTRPLYQATAQILIEHDLPNVLPTKELLETQGGADYYQTQYQLLRGRMLLEKAVEKLQLQKSTEFRTGPLMSPVERLQRRFLGKAPDVGYDSDGMPLSPAVAAFRSRLGVEPVPGSRLVNLRFSAYEPNIAAAAVNTLAELYIQQSLEFRFTTSSEATGWLSDRAAAQRQKVEAAERALQEYREREGLVNYEEGQGLGDQKVIALSTAVLQARTERIARESLYNQMRSLPSSQLASFPAVLANPIVQGLRTRLSEAQQKLSRLADTLGDRHPDMQVLRAEITANEDKLRVEIQSVLRSVESEYRTALQQETKLEANLEIAKRESLLQNRKAVEYAILKRDVETNQQLLKDLMGRSQETGLESGLNSELKSTNIRIVEKAETPRVPVSPQRVRNFQWAFLIGLGLGIGLAILFEHLDNTLKTPEDVKNYLGLPFLGMVPDVAARTPTASVLRPSPLILKNPGSAVAEAYRVLRTNLIFTSAEGTGRALVVSSANPGEGKTTTVANLASSLAQNGARVLAVDGDLRRPTMHQHFGIAKTPGLSDLIVGKCKASEAIQTTRFKGLQVLPCGYVPPNPAELLGSASMKEVLLALRSHYDWVLIDTPPILGMADTPVLCPLVDGVVLVVGAEVSGRPAIERAVDQILGVGGKITGVVLNKVDLERNSYYYGQYYGEYYRSYYAEGAGKPAPRPAAVSGPRPIRRA